MGGRFFHAVDGRHQSKVPVIAVSNMVAIIGRQRIWGRCDLRATQGYIHNGITNKYLRFGTHGRFGAFEDMDTISIRPVVSTTKSQKACREGWGTFSSSRTPLCQYMSAPLTGFSWKKSWTMNVTLPLRIASGASRGHISVSPCLTFSMRSWTTNLSCG